MNYFIERNQQQFGPYTLPDLQTYVASGSIFLTDAATDAQTGAVTSVAALLGQQPPPLAPLPPVPVSYVQPAGAPGTPVPPDLHWAIIFLISCVVGAFAAAWYLYQSIWIRKIDSQSKVSLYFGIGFGGMILLVGLGMFILLRDSNNPNPWGAVPLVLGFLFFLALLILSFFDMRRSMVTYYNTVEPIHLRLSAVMTFFFNVYYLQYHMSRIATWKKTGYLSPQS